MSEVDQQSTSVATDRRRVVNGAKVSPYRWPAPASRQVKAEPIAPSDAYALARAHQHKPWARRWLRQKGYRL